ncbi:hypothetical protein [Streptococcus sp. zg-JUN1979]|uniref:hypothetical protein n=1 Tax=Streptococcus sp. zg-JUN1979 TaxID=3391450 RepID=UPI0039A5B61F
MNPTELLNEVKDLIAKKDINAAKAFIDEHKDDLGTYFDQAKSLVEKAGGLDKALDGLKGLFNK